MSWAEEQILEGVIKKKLVLSSFYGQEKAGNIKAVIKDTGGSDTDMVGYLPYGDEDQRLEPTLFNNSIDIGSFIISDPHNKILMSFPYIYDFTSGIWTNTGVPLPNNYYDSKKIRDGYGCPYIDSYNLATPYNGKLYCAIMSSPRGSAAGSNYIEIKSLNPENHFAGGWTTEGTINVGYSSGNGVTVFPLNIVSLNDKFYVSVSMNAQSGPGWMHGDYTRTDLFEYNPSNNSGTKLATIDTESAAWGGRLCAYDDNLYFVASSKIYRFNISSKTSTLIMTATSRISSNVSKPFLFEHDDKLYLSLYDVTSPINGRLYEYDPTRDTLTPITFNTLISPGIAFTSVSGQGSAPLSNAICSTSAGIMIFASRNPTPAGSDSAPTARYKDIVKLNLDHNMFGLGPEDSLPYGFINGLAIDIDGKLNIFGTNVGDTKNVNNVDYRYENYELSRDTWVRKTSLPIPFQLGSVVKYNNEIHFLSNPKYHYKYSNQVNEWVSESVLPGNIYAKSSVAFDGNLYAAIGASLYLYSDNFNDWSVVNSLPSSASSATKLFIYKNKMYYYVNRFMYYYDNGEWIEDTNMYAPIAAVDIAVNGDLLYLVSGTDVYVYDGETYNSLPSLPYSFANGSLCIHDNMLNILGGNSQKDSTYYNKANILTYATHLKLYENRWMPGISRFSIINFGGVSDGTYIHILGGEGQDIETNHYKWNGTSWSEESEIPYGFHGGSVLYFGDAIHIFGCDDFENSMKHYSYNGTWSNEGDLPYPFSKGAAVVLNNEIHILGSNHEGYERAHYKLSSDSWVEDTELPYDFSGGIAIVINDKLHIIGGGYGSGSKFHYTYNETDGIWEKMQNIDFSVTDGKGVCYNNEIHIFNSYDHIKMVDNLTFLIDKTPLPYSFKNGIVELYRDNIHMLGGGDNKHYELHDPGIRPVKLEDVEIYFY